MLQKKLFLAKLAAPMIPVKSWRRKFLSRFENKGDHFRLQYPCPVINNAYYGKIYMPYYTPAKMRDDQAAEVYNKSGEKMDVFFIREFGLCMTSYINDSKYFLWDRFNIGLKTHFYIHDAILETMGKPDRRYGLFVESEAVIANQYKIFKTYKGIEQDFDAIFTFSENLLNSLPNAKLLPAAVSIWYGKEIYDGVSDPAVIRDDAYLSKEKTVSMICSAKQGLPLWTIRHRIARDALASGKVDLFGRVVGGRPLPYKSASLTAYRFQIVVENDVSAYYFTEKILDCFVAMTIPIYLGATKIDEFFNPAGIIKIDKDVSIEKILSYCNDGEYESRLEAVKENFYKALKYENVFDVLYEGYFKESHIKT